MPNPDPAATAQAIAAQDKTAIANALNFVEDKRPEARAWVVSLLEALDKNKKTKVAHRIGFTGPPGVGKSSLLAALCKEWRAQKNTVGIIAVDPSSVFSGGSLLGDRVRMGLDPKDQGLFLRSVATAGQLGGVHETVFTSLRVLEAAYDIVAVETTGVGQNETEVSNIADTIALVVQPGSGDALQFLKAGIMEIPHVLVVNKSDFKDTATRSRAELETALARAQSSGLEQQDQSWKIPILSTSATQGDGVADLVAALDQHRVHIAPQLAELRSEREARYCLQMFRNEHGRSGLQKLGGEIALREKIKQALDAGGNALSIVQNFGAEFLKLQ
jgi:LAO/AO transport system kinase